MQRVKHLFLVFAILIALSGFAMANHVVKTSSGGTSYSYNDNTANAYNITINNTDLTTTANITQVNITLPSSFSLVSSSNWTDAIGTFSSSGRILTWQNNAGLVMNESINYFSFNAISLIPGDYNLTVTTLNATGAFNSNISVTINDTTAPTINYTTPSANNSFYKVLYLIFNITAEDYGGVDTLTLRVYNSSSILLNTTTVNSTELPLYLNLSNLTAGTYYYNVTVNDTNNNINNSVTRQAMIDTTPPVVTDLAFSNTETTMTVTISIDESGSGISSCTAKRDSTTVTVSGSGNSQRTISDSGLECDTSYKYNVTCTDNAGGVGAYYAESHSTDSCSDDDDDSGGDGGGSETTTSFWTSTFAPTDFQIRMGYCKDLKKGERVKAKVGNETHYVGVIKVSSTSATINVSSTPQQAVLDVGETKKFEVTNDNYYDLSVTLNGINNSQVNLTVLYIYEQILESASVLTTDSYENTTALTGAGFVTTNNETQTSASLYKRTGFWIAFILIIALAAAGGGFFYYIRRKRIRTTEGLENPSV